jgi:hypothetical protein
VRYATSLFDLYDVRRVSSQILYTPLLSADTYEYSSISINSILASLCAGPDPQKTSSSWLHMATCHGTACWFASYPGSSSTSDRSNVGLAQSICRWELSMPRFISHRLPTSQKMIAPCMVLYRISALSLLFRNAATILSEHDYIDFLDKIKWPQQFIYYINLLAPISCVRPPNRRWTTHYILVAYLFLLRELPTTLSQQLIRSMEDMQWKTRLKDFETRN